MTAMNIHSQATIRRTDYTPQPRVVDHHDGTVSVILAGDDGHVSLAGTAAEVLQLLADARKALLDDVTSRVVDAADVPQAGGHGMSTPREEFIQYRLRTDTRRVVAGPSYDAAQHDDTPISFREWCDQSGMELTPEWIADLLGEIVDALKDQRDRLRDDNRDLVRQRDRLAARVHELEQWI